MKLELINQAHNVPNFENQANELTDVLNENVYFKTKEDEELICTGFKLALDMIEKKSELIQPTLYKTMKAVKKEYNDLSKFTRDYKKVSAVSLAVNYLYNINLRIATSVKSKIYAENQLKQYKEDERITIELVSDIAKMLGKKVKQPKDNQPVKRKSIWVLNVQENENGKPFIAGYKQKEVATLLGISASSVHQAIKRNQVVHGYKIWKEETV